MSNFNFFRWIKATNSRKFLRIKYVLIFCCFNALPWKKVRLFYFSSYIESIVGITFQNICTATVTKSEDSTLYGSNCLLSNLDPETVCNKSKREGNTVITTCCCHTQMCNDKKFLKNCMVTSTIAVYVV